jgi:hypothetical protein
MDAVQRLVEKRIMEIDYLLHMNQIDRDPLTQDEVIKIIDESDDLKIWLKKWRIA